MHHLTLVLSALAPLTRFVTAAPRLLVCAGLVSASLSAAPVPAGAESPPPLAFTLKDQFDREYTEACCADRTALLLIADRKGSAFVGKWSAAIGSELKTVAHPPVQWVGVATLSGVPSFMRGMVKKMSGSDRAHWTLMDWQGVLAKAYALPAGHTSILVFAPDRRLVLRISGREVDPSVVSSVVAAVVASTGTTTASTQRSSGAAAPRRE